MELEFYQPHYSAPSSLSDLALIYCLPTAGRNSPLGEFPNNPGDGFFGVAEQHSRVFAEEEGVVYTGKAGCH